MPTPAQFHNIGAFLVPKIGTLALASSGEATNGTGFDCTTWNSLQLVVSVGAATGTPNSLTVDAKIQHANDVSGSPDSYTDYVPTIGAAAITQITTGSKIGSVNVDLAEAKQFIRVVTTTTLVSGTTPTLPVAAVCIMGGSLVDPNANF